VPRRRKGETLQQCVKRAIPIIKREHPKKTMKQVLGQAYGMCRSAKGKRSVKRRKKRRR